MHTSKNFKGAARKHTKNKPLIAKKSDVMHRIEMGSFFSAFYDTETTDLSKRFAEITQFGATLTDIAGNVIHTVDLRGKPSDHTIISPVAWVIQRLRREDLDKGDPQYILAGKIMQFFRHASRLHEAPFSQEFLKTYCRKVTTGKDDAKKTHYAYPLANDDGTIDWDCIRIGNNLREYAYKDPKVEGRWITKKIGAMCIGYNNISADDQWIWSLLHMACAETVFVTHQDLLGKKRLDALRAVVTAVATGKDGENNIRAGVYKDALTGKESPSFRQGDILAANTRMQKDLRGIAAGITLPDGSQPDLSQLHGAFTDAVALMGIYHYLRDHHSDVLCALEKNSDWKGVVQRLTENPDGFGNHPIVGYVDKKFRSLHGHMACLIGTDQYRHQPKQALMLNLNIDLDAYRHNGKKLVDLTAEEHGALINQCRNDLNGPYKVIRTHHSPRIIPEQMAFDAGFNDDLDKNTLMKRARLARNPAFAEAAMSGMRLAYPRLFGPGRKLLPQPEEYVFSSLSTVEMYDPAIGEDVQVANPKDGLERQAIESRKNALRTKKLWMRAISSDEDILFTPEKKKSPPKLERAMLRRLWRRELSDEDKSLLRGNNICKRDITSSFPKLTVFAQKLHDIQKELQKNNGPALPIQDELIMDSASALRYKVKLLYTARQHFENGDLQDISQHYRFEDKEGHEIPNDTLTKWREAEPWRLDMAFDKKEINIRHEDLYITPQIIDRILSQLGYGHICGPDIEQQVTASQKLRIHGIPQLGHDRQRWCTVESAWQSYQKLKNNELTREDIRAIEDREPGSWQLFMPGNRDTQASLGEYKQYIDGLRRVSFPPLHQELVGIDPETGYEIEKVRHEIDKKNVLRIKVPDRYLQDPPHEALSDKPLWLTPLRREFKGRALPKNTEIILEGARTGKTYHIPDAKVVSLPAQGGINDNFYQKARTQFSASGYKLPTDKKMVALSGAGPYPLHNTRPINDNHQTLHIPARHFEGILDHKLASYSHKVSGIIFRDDHLQLGKGAVRLLETNSDDHPTGWEVTTNVTQAKQMTLKEICKFSDKQAFKYGYPTIDVMVDAVSTMFSDYQLDPNDPNNKVWVVNLGRVKPHDPKTGTAYHNPTVQKTSAIKPDFKI